MDASLPTHFLASSLGKAVQAAAACTGDPVEAAGFSSVEPWLLLHHLESKSADESSCCVSLCLCKSIFMVPVLWHSM